MSATGNKPAGIFRGGWWNFEYEHTYNEYMSGCLDLLDTAGKAIAGFPKQTLHDYSILISILLFEVYCDLLRFVTIYNINPPVIKG